MLLKFQLRFAVFVGIISASFLFYVVARESIFLVGVSAAACVAAFSLAAFCTIPPYLLPVIVLKSFPFIHRRLKSNNRQKSTAQFYDINEEIAKFIECLVNSCLRSWYTEISDCNVTVTDAETFLTFEIYQLASHLSRANRCRILSKIINLYTAHIKRYCKKTSGSAKAFCEGPLHMTAVVDNELSYVTAVTNCVFEYLSKQQEINCLTAKEIVVQILAKEVILKLSHLMSQPEWIYNAVVEILSDVDDNTSVLDNQISGSSSNDVVSDVSTTQRTVPINNSALFALTNTDDVPVVTLSTENEIEFLSTESSHSASSAALDDNQLVMSPTVMNEANGLTDTVNGCTAEDFIVIHDCDVRSKPGQDTNHGDISCRLIERHSSDVGNSPVAHDEVSSFDPGNQHDVLVAGSVPSIAGLFPGNIKHLIKSVATLPTLVHSRRSLDLGSYCRSPSSADTDAVASDAGCSADAVDEAMEADEEIVTQQKPEKVFDSISIGETETGQIGSDTYTLYVINVWAWYQISDSGWHMLFTKVKRRYREFITLQNVLHQNTAYANSLKGIKCPSRLTSFPFLTNISAVAESRRKSLQRYLQALLSRIDINNSDELKVFLGYESDASIAFEKQVESGRLHRIDRALVRTISGVVNKITTIMPSASETPKSHTSLSHTNLSEVDGSNWVDEDASNINIASDSSVLHCSCSMCEPSRPRTAFHVEEFTVISPAERSQSCASDHPLEGKTLEFTEIASSLLDLVAVALTQTGCWLMSSSVFQLIRCCTTHFLDLWLQAEISILTSPVQCALYINLLTNAIWYPSEAGTSHCLSSHERLFISRQRARTALVNFLPEFIHLLPGQRAFDDAIDLFLDSVQDYELNRLFIFHLLELLVAEVLPEMCTESYRHHLHQLFPS